MGLFNKIKNILFEADEEETEEIPVYTKEEKTVVREEPVVSEVPKIEEELINTSDSSYFSNIKRDIDYSYDEVDVLAEVPGAKNVVSNTYEEPVVTQEAPKEEKKSPFLTFDEDEFERLNSRINKNESRAKKDREISNNISNARKTNGNFSATTTSNVSERANIGQTKKFTPSLVISPVYGVLNKNYTKEDIVDKKDGLKREIVKPIVRKEIVKEEPINEIKSVEKENKVDIDSIRKKAFGDSTKRERLIEHINDVVNVKEKDILIEEHIDESKNDILIVEDELELDFPKTVDIVETIDNITEELEENNEINPVLDTTLENSDDVLEDEEINENVEEILEDDSIDVEEILVNDLPFIKEEKEIDNEDNEDAIEKKKNKIDKSKILNDLEKTSTLQILDDIERELNSIKPITDEYDDNEDLEKDKIERNDTLENDLFNLIDSMYEEGEEEEDD